MPLIANVIFDTYYYTMQLALADGTVKFLCPGDSFLCKNFYKGIQGRGFFNAGKKMSYRLLTGGTTAM